MTVTGVVPPAHAVDRPALRRRLDEALNQPLTLIVAPAGAGKSLLVAQWAASHAELIRLMTRIQQEAARMGLLVEDLLLLAHLDEDRPLDQEPVDLSSIAAEASSP